jgi:DNA-binding GntR family transcriptional regulator
MAFPAERSAIEIGTARTRAERVADQLREMIISGELTPGTHLRQAELAHELKVSTTPIREALASLAREGFVRQDPHRGVEVFRPTEADIRENYEIRLQLEPFATELAAPIIGDGALAELNEIVVEMDKTDEFQLGTDLNRRLHLVIYQAANRPLLLDMIERLRRSADAYVRVLLAHAPPRYVDDIRHEHHTILAALQAHDPVAARQAMTTHLSHSVEQIKQLIPETAATDDDEIRPAASA